MAHEPNDVHESSGASGRDPRLEIPEVLRKPVPQGNFDPVYGSATHRPKPLNLEGAGRAWGTAMNFVFTIIAGLALGLAFDKWQKTIPWGTLIGLTIGFVAAFYQIVRQTQREERSKKPPNGGPARR